MITDRSAIKPPLDPYLWLDAVEESLLHGTVAQPLTHLFPCVHRKNHNGALKGVSGWGCMHCELVVHDVPTAPLKSEKRFLPRRNDMFVS